jgi:drug/metabolite transporter (DMT)-like permease
MKGTTIALISCMFLALEPIFGKILVRHMSPLILAGMSTLFASLILFSILEVEHRIWELFRLKKRELLVLFAVAIISGMAAQIFYLQGLRESTATNAVLLTRLNSLLIALMGVFFLRERLGIQHILGTALMVGGILVIHTQMFTLDIKPMAGDGYLVLAALCWASANILMKKYLSHVPPEIIVIGYNGFAGLTLLLATAQLIPETLNAEVITYLVGFIILVNLVGRYLWYWAFEHTSACNVGLASLSIPLFGVLYSIILLSETLSRSQIIGGIMIFAGLVVIEYHQICSFGVEPRHVEHRLKRHHPHH